MSDARPPTVLPPQAPPSPTTAPDTGPVTQARADCSRDILSRPPGLDADHPARGSMPRLQLVLLILLVALLVGLDAYWILEHTAPPTWDQAWYLSHSTSLYYALREGGLRPFYESYLLAVGRIKPPLLTVLAVPFYFIFGPGERVALLSNLAFVVLLNVSLFALLRERLGAEVGLLTAAITGTMPLILNLSHQFLAEYGLAALVVLWLYLLYRSDAYRQRGCTVLLGVVLGLGLLMKILFPLYILGPALVMFLARAREDGFRRLRRLVLDVLWMIVTALVVAGTWYRHNLRWSLGFAFSTSFGPTAQNYSLGSIFDWRTISAYWLQVTNRGVSAFYLCALGVLLLLYLIRVALTRQTPRVSRDTLVLGSWFLIPFIPATFGVNKDIRYLSPTFPVVGLLIALLFWRTCGIRWGQRLWPLLLIWPLLAALFVMIPTDKLNGHLAYRGLVLLDDKHHQNPTLADTPRAERWPLVEILDFVQHDAFVGRRDATLQVAVDHHYLNLSTLEFYCTLHRYPIRLAQLAYRPKTESLPELYAAVKKSRYVLVKTGYQGPDFTNDRNAALRARLQISAEFQPIRTFALPDGSEVEIYRQ